MVGSKRRATIQGHIVMADGELVPKLRRLPTELLRPLFQQAKDHGSAVFTIDGQSYRLERQSDHTFLCQPGQNHRLTL